MPITNRHIFKQNKNQALVTLEKSKEIIITKILRKLTKSISVGSITFKLDNGINIKCDSGYQGPNAVINIHSYKVLKKLLSGGYLGLSEGYINQEWTTPSLSDVFNFGAENINSLDQNLTENLFVKVSNQLIRFFQQNSRRGSRKNIAIHYDLGNDFFKEWLDSTMTYSSALFSNKGDKLDVAQNNKYQRIIEKLDISTSHSVLEIGCGWGGFAEYAALKTKTNITGLTISNEQFNFAVKRINKNNLSKNVSILLQDYRDVIGQFDRIVSIEMLEAVGEAYWPTYFKTISDRLKKNGAAMIQVITVPDDYFNYYRNSMDFIQRYIFPGGMLLCPEKISEHSTKVGLTLVDTHMFGSSYAETLEQWQSSFQTNWHRIEKIGFDKRFKRIWEYYLDYTAAGFRSGAINVGQFHLRKS